MTEAAAAVAAAYRTLDRMGMNTGSTGNVSARLPGGMVITATGVDAADPVTVTMDLNGRFEGNRPPSSEWQMHAGIYRAAAGAEFIVHTHADACTALACLAEGLPAFHYMIAAFGGDDVRCAPYATFGTPALARATVAALAGRRACLLANHGMVVHGRDAPHALLLARQLETLCRHYLLARAAGTPRLLTKDEMQAARARFASYGR
jgi:L-fuculose-phosphate aldolase